jgi:hypothetical protein
MVEEAHNANWNAEVPRRGMRALWRLAIWGSLATFALFAAVLSTYSHAGAERRIAAIALGQGTTAAESRSAESAEETRRLAETMRSLAADRDRLITRMAALERKLDGITGSIKRERAGPPSPSPPPNASAAAGAAPVARPDMPPAPTTEAAVTAAAPPLPPPPVSQPAGAADAAQPPASDAGNRAMASASNPMHATAASEPPTAVAKLGIDVGGGINFEGLRTLWRSAKNSDPTLPEELYPVVNVRENGKTHAAELRLIVGPIGDADEAARLCMTLAAAHHYCQPVAFEGQRLPLVDAAPAKAAPPHHGAPTPPNVLSESPTHPAR